MTIFSDLIKHQYIFSDGYGTMGGVDCAQYLSSVAAKKVWLIHKNTESYPFDFI